MTKAIRSYPEAQRARVIDRRMRQYDPKGGNGLGVLAAAEHFYKKAGRALPNIENAAAAMKILGEASKKSKRSVDKLVGQDAQG